MERAQLERCFPLPRWKQLGPRKFPTPWPASPTVCRQRSRNPQDERLPRRSCMSRALKYSKGRQGDGGESDAGDLAAAAWPVEDHGMVRAAGFEPATPTV